MPKLSKDSDRIRGPGDLSRSAPVVVRCTRPSAPRAIVNGRRPEPTRPSTSNRTTRATDRARNHRGAPGRSKPGGSIEISLGPWSRRLLGARIARSARHRRSAAGSFRDARRSWESRSSSRTTAARSRAGSSSGACACNGALPSWSCACPPACEILEHAGTAVESILDCALDGAEFVFGEPLVDPKGPAAFVFAFRVLPTVIFVAALFAVLYHLGVMQWVVRGFAVVMAWLMGTSGAESLNVAASLFLGQTEAPLTIRPYLRQADPVGAARRS